MASIWVTGSSAGIGRQTAITLVQMGHRVVLHARNEQRAVEAEQAVPGAAAVVIGDLASLAETRWHRRPGSTGRTTSSSITRVLVGSPSARLPPTGWTRYSR